MAFLEWWKVDADMAYFICWCVWDCAGCSSWDQYGMIINSIQETLEAWWAICNLLTWWHRAIKSPIRERRFRVRGKYSRLVRSVKQSYRAMNMIADTSRRIYCKNGCPMKSPFSNKQLREVGKEIHVTNNMLTSSKVFPLEDYTSFFSSDTIMVAVQ
jgi:hypothetical protein